jgi:aerobic carbon-monoxide dehydrogenase large subunit
MVDTQSGNNWIGKKFSRKEDDRLITGKGQYLADIELENCLVLKFVRSTCAHGIIKSIDTSIAEQIPGVLAIYTGEDIRDVITPLPTASTQPFLEADYPRHWPLAVDKVKFNGEPVAAVVAIDKYIAEDAIEQVIVEYEDLPVVIDPEFALTADAPVIHDEFSDNEIFKMTLTGGFTPEEQEENAKKVAAIFEQADVVVSERFRTHRCGVTPMETRGAIAKWEEQSGLQVWMTTQRPHIDRLVFSELFNIPQNKIQVSAPRDQGGAFGVKAPVYREPILLTYLSIKLGRPIKWVETREEHLMSVSQERDQIHYLELAADSDGRILALRNNIIADNGDGCEGVFWGLVMPFYGAAMVPNGYDIQNCDITITCATTNKSALSPARAFGTLPGRFAVDRAIDMLARKIGKEPADVRRLNIIKNLPYDTATGMHFDKADYVAVWDKLLEHIDLPAFRNEQKKDNKGGRRTGIGFSIGVHSSGVASEALVPMEGQPGYGSAIVRIDSGGTVQVYEGDAPQGQGHETVMAQITAEILGLSPDEIVLHAGNTNNSPFASGTFGARGGSYTASAVAIAAKKLREKIAKVFIHDKEIDATPEDIHFSDGIVNYKVDESISVSFAELADRIVMKPLNLPEGLDAGLEETAFFEAKEPMVSFSIHAVIVEVDEYSGEIDIKRYVSAEDVGRVINPQIVEGQVHGGIVQGISNTMFEEFIYDENGQQLSTTLENYKLANAADVSNIEVIHSDVPCEHTPLGTRGMGEGTPGPVPAAICNAICDALTHLNIEITELPMRPDRLWKLIQDSR